MRYILKCLPVCLACSLLLLFFSCKKETEYSLLSANDIVSYTVTVDGQSMEASVKGDSLIVYWPWPVIVPATITPKIITANGAGISPASGTAVSCVTGTSYSVTTADGRQKTYYLKIVKNWPDLDIRVKTTTANRGRGTQFILNGLSYVLPDISQTKVTFVARKTGVPTDLVVNAVTESTITVTIPATIPLDTSAEEGSWLRIESGGRVLELKSYIIYVPY